MLNEIDLKQKISKKEYKREKDDLTIRLGELQRGARERGVPVVIVFEGWNAAGKGTLINRLILPLDPRGFKVFSMHPPRDEEALRPFLWRFAIRAPERGRIAVFDRSWYRRHLFDRVEQNLSDAAIQSATRDILAFERHLVDDGCVLIKFFLHISRNEQKARLEKLQANPLTAWRVTRDDIKRNKRYDRYVDAADAMLADTGSTSAPWTIVEAHDTRFAALKIFKTVEATLEKRLALPAPETPGNGRGTKAATSGKKASPLRRANLERRLSRETYDRLLPRRQKRLRELEHEIYMRRIPVVVVYEGWDAAGKGGNIKRLVRKLDPRGYEVVPIVAPNDAEKARHYLWRFWTQIPKAGHLTVFDRSWYGRVMVERVEGFCSEAEWRRAYEEINEFERHLTDFGTVLVKFWLHIDRDEQMRRFKARQRIPHKQWKITEEDWRNRKKWDPYQEAVEEMLSRTSPPRARWTVVESNDKLHARIKTLDTVIRAIEARL